MDESLIAKDDYPIKPWDINTKCVLVKSLGGFNMEYSARVIVLFCKMREDWVPFTDEQLREAYPEETANAHFDLTLLEQKGFIILDGKICYLISKEMVNRLRRASMNTSQGS